MGGKIVLPQNDESLFMEAQDVIQLAHIYGSKPYDVSDIYR